MLINSALRDKIPGSWLSLYSSHTARASSIVEQVQRLVLRAPQFGTRCPFSIFHQFRTNTLYMMFSLSFMVSLRQCRRYRRTADGAKPRFGFLVIHARK